MTPGTSKALLAFADSVARLERKFCVNALRPAAAIEPLFALGDVLTSGEAMFTSVHEPRWTGLT
jgi:hypothetical protein